MTEPNELTPELELHYWHPVPKPDGRRHAFRGGRHWDGRPNAGAVCGTTVPMAAASETDRIHKPTCEPCWETLTSEVVAEFGPWHSSDRDRALAPREAHKLSTGTGRHGT